MNELALQLQYLRYVDQVRFEGLYAPREQITAFMRLVIQAQKIRPLIRKIRARRLRRDMVMKNTDHVAETLSSLFKPIPTQNDHPVFDWSSAIQDDSHGGSEESRDETLKSMTQTPNQGKPSSSLLKDAHLQDEYKARAMDRMRKEDLKLHAQTHLGDRKRQRSSLTDPSSLPDKWPRTFHD